MRRLFQLIGKFRTFILFVILLITSFVLISKSRSMQGVDILSSSNCVAGYLYKKQNSIVYYFGLRRMNDDLLEENKILKNQIAQLQHIDFFSDTIFQIAEPIVRTSESIKAGQESMDSSHSNSKMESSGKARKYASYLYIPARVVNNSISNSRINHITINRGSSDNVKPGMAVVSLNGIVGRVANTTKNYATIESVLSVGDRKVSSKLADGTIGFTEWIVGKPEYVSMNKLPQHAKVGIGDSIYTTGYSFFPENVLIGIVTQIDTTAANNLLNLKVRLSTDFRRLQYVYVVADELGEERRGLEAKNNE